ncbi:MAG TPA: TonB-dependent receptor, partial [Planctomycetota bacterium]|nr:TonB-dependent receptor [Planctomycetota bacterium]
QTADPAADPTSDPTTDANADAADDGALALPDVYATSPRSEIPSSAPRTQVTVITGEQLRATGERSLPRQIAAAGPAWVQETNLGGGSIFLGGLTGNQVLLIVDGVRLNDSTTRIGPNQLLNTIDPTIVDRVELVRGPSSVLYGSDAIGGTVLIWTVRRAPGELGGTQGPEAVAGAEANSQAWGARPYGSFSHAGERFGWMVAGSYQTWSDVRAGDGETQDFTGYDGYDLFATASWSPAADREWRWTSRYHRDSDVPRTDALTEGYPTSVGGPPTPPSDLRRHFAEQEYQSHILSFTDADPGRFADRWQVRFSVRGSDEERERITVSNPSEIRYEEDVVTTFGLGMDWRKDVGGGHELVWGLDADHDDVDSTRTDVDIPTGTPTMENGEFAPGSRYTRFGVFVQDEWLANDWLDMTGGVRYSLFDFEFEEFEPPVAALPGDAGGEGSFDELTASLQAAASLSEHWRLVGTLAQGYRAPNLSELAKLGAFGGGVELPNPDLEPEQSLYHELALDARYDTWDGGVALFYHDIDDVIGRVYDPVASAALGQDAYARENQGKLVLYGVDFVAASKLGGADSPWAVDGTLTYTHGQLYDETVEQSTGDTPYYDVPWRRVPPLWGTVGIEHEPLLPLLGFVDQSRFYVLWADAQDRLHPEDISDPRIDPNGTPGWATLNLSFSGRIGKGPEGGEWTLAFLNLTDEHYRVHGSGFDAPGLGVALSLRWAF